jgi:hypothetical protein
MPNHLDDTGARAAPPTVEHAVTGADRRTLNAIFQHPLAHNLSWREAVNLMEVVGGAEEKHNGEFMFSIGDERLPMKRPHGKDLTSTDVMDLRHFLTRAGCSPESGDPCGRFPPTTRLAPPIRPA